MAKLAYAEGFAPWGWIVASGLYLDDLNAAFRHDALMFVGQIAVLAAAGLAGICHQMGADPPGA